MLAGTIPAREDCNDFNATVSKLFVFALMWSVGALLELEDRLTVLLNTQKYLEILLTF